MTMIVSERSPDAKPEAVAVRRRISTSTAVPILLACAALGFAFGTAYPPDKLFAHWQFGSHKSPAAPAERTAAAPAPAQASHEPTPARAAQPATPPAPNLEPSAPAEQRASESEPRPAPTQSAGSAEPAPVTPILLNKPAPVASPAPQDSPPSPSPASASETAPSPATAPDKTAAVEEVRPDSRPLAVVGEKTPSQVGENASSRAEERGSQAGQVEQPSPRGEERSAGQSDAGSRAQKAERRGAEKRRTARSRRQQYAERGSGSAEPQPKGGVISQIPIVGPVVGLVLPF